MNYIKSSLFLVFFLIYVYCIGFAICDNDSHESKKIIIGYVVHSAFAGFIGVIVQLLNLPWKLYMICHLLMIVAIFVICILKIRVKSSLNVFQILKKHMLNMWFVYVLASIMITLSAFNIQLQLLNNHLDDGLYLMRIAQLPYLNHPFATTYATGFPSNGITSIGALSYAFNVFDLEASVYNYILGTVTTVFVRFGMNWLNYYLFVTSFLWLISELLKRTKISENNYQYMTVFIILLCFYPEWLTYVYNLPDDWQISTAMWYGSSIVRCMGIFLYFNILINEKNIKKLIMYWIATTLALMTKSSIALPLVFVGFIVYIGYFIFLKNSKLLKYYIFIYMLICVTCCFTFGVPSKLWKFGSEALFTVEGIKTLVVHNLTLLSLNNKYPVVILSVIILIIFIIQTRQKTIKKWSIIMAITSCLLIIPVVNYPVIVLSLYSFVIRRMFTMTIYTLILTSSAYLLLIMYGFLKRKNYQLILSMCVCLSIVIGATFFYKNNGYSIRNSFNYLKNNAKLMPTDTLELSKKLDVISNNKDEELYVLAPDVIFYPEGMHALSVVLRINAPSIKVVSALPRYGANDKKYSQYSESEQICYRDFSTNPNTNEEENVENLLHKYNEINCLVTTYELQDNVITILNLKFNSVVKNSLNYYIYTVNN